MRHLRFQLVHTRPWAVACALGLLLACEETSHADLATERDPVACALRNGAASTGGLGLLAMPLADGGCPWQLRMGLQLNGFVQHGHLVVGDRFQQLQSGVQISASLGSFVESWLQLDLWNSQSQSAISAVAAAAMDGTPQQSLTLGRVSVGVKLHSTIRHGVRLAVQPHVRVHSGPEDVGPAWGSLDAGLMLLGSYSLAEHRPLLPLRLSVRLGYLHDRSSTVLGSLDCMARGAVECLATHLTYESAFGIGQPRVEFAGALDYLFHPTPSLWIQPAVVYSLGVVTGSGDPVLAAQLAASLPTLTGTASRVAQQVTVSGRVFLPWPVVLELGLQVGVTSWGYTMGAKLPQLAGFGAITFALDLLSRGDHTRPLPGNAQADPHAVSTRGGERPGSVRGTVRDKTTGSPLPGALVRFVGSSQNALLTDGQGSFHSGELRAGTIELEVGQSGHQALRRAVTVRAGETVSVELALPQSQRSELAKLELAVRNEAGAPVSAQSMAVRQGPGGTQRVELVGEGGTLRAQLPAGAWRVQLQASGYLSKEALWVFVAGEQKQQLVLLSPRPQPPRVWLLAKEISVQDSALLLGGDALSPAAKLVLGEVVDLLIHHREIALVELLAEGSPPGERPATDRLIAIREFLLQAGTAPERIRVAEPQATPRPMNEPLTPGTQPPRPRGARIVFRIGTPTAHEDLR